MPKKKVDEKKGWIRIFPEFNPVRVKYKDIFDMKQFYEDLHEWTLEYGWKDYEEDLDRYETYYGERIAQGGAKELWLIWRLQKTPAGVPTIAGKSSLTYYLDIYFHCIGLTTAEVVKEGRKMSVNKGEIEITIETFLEKNYETGFDQSSMLKPFKDLFSKRLYHKVLEQRKKELYQETYVFQNWIKQWFKLKRYQPYEETKGFFTSKAWPSHLRE
ncbi:TPA: hypothetical protein HA242_03390 [Candidatus Woesearchaeota archaeon]|nr:hypothetical protein [Candidatus Woesearchaeota archaeon]HIG93639.1 hypothetical protein [Candidatus Woesearchaeota archaeon]HIH12741.1 hypothetical protein [Candidatus Woesearchaeota archaeon]